MKSDFVDSSSKFGLKEHEFCTLNPERKQKLVRLMARIMERAYRRGVQQTLALKEKGTIDEWIIDNPHSYRYDKSLAISIGLDGFTSSSIERLFMEEKLQDIGFDEE
ncbi:MAG TPA: hypothetical protein VGK47_11355 [Nitrososphaeraceae archaeon]